MERRLLQQLTASELEQYQQELGAACERHAEWLARLNRTLICHSQPDPDDLAKTPHRHCRFGRWYYGVDNPVLNSNSHFIRIGDVHEMMHSVASKILSKSLEEEPITTREYDQLAQLALQLREATDDLRDEMQGDRALNAKVLGAIFENAREGVIITDTSGTIISVNRAFENVTGFGADEIIGKSPNILYSGRHDDEFYRKMWQCIESEGTWSGEIWNRRKDGKEYLEWLSISSITNNEGDKTHYIGIFSDITSEKESIERIQYLAHYDQLTDLPNRVLFQDRLKQALAKARRDGSEVAVLFMDLDGFKEVNDSVGHSIGDALLQQVAKRLLSHTRESDTVSRFGGDEFILLLTSFSGKNGVAGVAGKILEEIDQPFEVEGHTLHVTTSIGISLFPADGDDCDTLLKRADIAMYQAKRNGKNQFRYFLSDIAPEGL